jgi:hypothetical protein
LLVYVQWWAGSVTAAAELLTLGVALVEALAEALVLAAGEVVLEAAELGDFPPLNRKNAPAMRPSTMTAAPPLIAHLRTWSSRRTRRAMRRS